MKIAPVTAPDSASDPAHPDHDRWVKDYTLRMEVEHAKRLGLPLRAAEAENRRLLERTEQIAKETKTPKKKRKRPTVSADMDRARRRTRLERLQERAVRIRAAMPQVAGVKLSPCGRCGVCRRCMRERRVLLMIQKANAGDRAMLGLLWPLVATAIDAKGGAGRFAEMAPTDADRIVTAKAEAVCDSSVRWLGEWR